MEQPSFCQQMEAETSQRFNNPVRIRIIAYRSKKTDCLRSISEKALVDALVKTKVLINDSDKEIPEEPIIEWVKSDNEKTVIEITEI